MTDFPQLIGGQMKVPAKLVADALRLAHARYRKIHVKKRSGGHRTIAHPAAELKLVHAWLSAEVLARLPISAVATAFRPGASIVKNAAVHKDSLYSVRVDLHEFFPSLRSGDLMKVVLDNKAVLPRFVEASNFHDFIRLACFDQSDRLPIGYPTSPAIANAVMYDIDTALEGLIRGNPEAFGNARLTRYADDFVFSTDRRGACREFIRTIERQLSVVTSPELTLNTAKTRLMSRRGGSTLVTGLRINQDGLVRVHANYRDHVRLLLKHFAAGTLVADDVPRLVGHLAFIEHADPRLFTRLSFRYFEEIGRLRGR